MIVPSFVFFNLFTEKGLSYTIKITATTSFTRNLD